MNVVVARKKRQVVGTVAVLAALLLLASMMILVGAAPARTIDCGGANVVAPVGADSWIDQNSTSANKGSDSILKVQAKQPDSNFRALVRFSLPVEAPQGCVMESARLRLYAASGGEGSKLEAVRLAYAWQEDRVTWGNQPETLGTAAVTWAGDGYIQWNVTAQVRAMIEGANHGFLIRDAAGSSDAGGEQAFHSREIGETPPELVIRFKPDAPGKTPGPPAAPTLAAVSCGEVLTRSTLVTNDLSNCLGDGLTIDAPNIIVDLGGHTIDGVGLGVGVRNNGYGTVTVRNGTVQDFDHGVQLLPEAKLNVVERLILRSNELTGVEISDANGSEVRTNTLEDNGDGISLLTGTTGTVVVDNTISLNRGAGLLVSESDANRLENNRVSGGGNVGVELEHASGNTLLNNTVSSNSDGGIQLSLASNGNRVEDNTVTESGGTGILVAESDRNELISNTIRDMSDSGITLSVANDGVVRGNDLRFNPGGLEMDGSNRNLIESNNASETTGTGIEVLGDSFDNAIVRNTANANGARGIYVFGEALIEPGNLLDRNTASDNLSDGIVVAKGGHTIFANVARDNSGLGIDASPGNADGGDNTASGNGASTQCVGVVCKAEWVPPDTTITDMPDDPSSDDSASFGFTGTDDTTPQSALRFECRLDGADTEFAGCSSPQGYAGLSDGTHTFEVRAIDRLGNVDPTPASYSWAFVPPDTTLLETAVDSGPDDTTTATSATFAFSADEPNSKFECSLDGTEFASCASPKEYADLGIGNHELRVRATDPAGNTDETPASYAWTVEAPPDTTPPETTITERPADPSTSGSANFGFTGSDNESLPSALRFECRLDGQDADWASCTSPKDYAGLSEGTHTFEVRAIDRLGNVDPTPASHSWAFVPPDTTPPRTEIYSGPEAPTTETSARFEFSSEPGAAFECALDGGPFAECASPHEVRDLSVGAHRFEVRATDAAGNTEAPASYTWTVKDPPDTTAPETTLVDKPDATTTETVATFTFYSEPDATFECSLDGEPLAGCASPEEYADLTVGEHTFEVRATDVAGNTEVPVSYRWTVETPPDTTAPETTITERPADPSTSDSASFGFAGHDDVTPAADLAFQCRLDGQPEADWLSCSSPRTYSGLAEGSHAFEVRAIDRAGNVDPTPANHVWKIGPPPDTTPPETTLGAGGPSGETTATSATFAFSANEANSTFECSLDGTPFEACTSPRAYAGLSPGSHEFRVRATDPAGNADTTAASRTWTISAPPTCAAASTTSGASADSWVLQSSRRSNGGSDSILKVESRSGANARALVRFGLPAIPTGCQMADVKLRLYASSFKAGRTLQALRLAGAWTESGVTWNNQPATTGAAATAASASAAGYVEWTVTEQVRNMYSGANNGFLIRDSATSRGGLEQGFHSREKGTDRPPEIVIAFR